jgi:hypothetical protein
MSKFENVSIVREANIRFCQNGESAAHPEALCHKPSICNLGCGLLPEFSKAKLASYNRIRLHHNQGP